jgi:nitrate reductase gamma subunit
MNGATFLLWVRDTGFVLASSIFIIGLTIRLFEIFMLGRKKDLSEPKGCAVQGGFKTMFSRFLPQDSNTFQRSNFIIISGYVFHIGLLVALFLFVPHIELIRATLGFGWVGLPTPVVDFLTVLSLIAMLALLYHRLTNPVLKMISDAGDYVAWGLTFVPLLTGYLAYHHLFFDYTWLLAFHILSAEILMAMLPFTKLIHTFTVFISRFYGGAIAGRKGVQA